MTKIVFIGAGSMSEALISGIISSKMIDNENIFVTNSSNKKRLNYLHSQYGVNFTYKLDELVQDADVVILAMKPKDVKQGIGNIQAYLSEKTLLISVLAGVSIKSLELLAGKKLPVARAMPNTSAAVGKSATGIAVNETVTDTQMELILNIFQTVGLTAVVEETKIDAVTGLSGSGPAYFYYIVEAMEKGASEIGLDPDIANDFIVQTLKGAAEMIATSKKSPLELRQNVTSPGGTTEAGIKVLESFDVQTAFINCMKEAVERSKTMGKTISEELKVSN
ncbi:pyrroline-5-carboxylate reductase [Niallia sp. NCCP-28]|uniref:pyrroline-5-carboxylate reductase n=1 Tax=Niallia sp. NCCP-28 TaxID=2934712 RepID=UPI00208AEC11|nr:pyrroline-5-carboxylate reductase [Niallia sp. NCCP-28]GKU81098.1 pyrroline-5-carboxylate reductase [Niallia sp. NCCP-28]